MIELYYPHNTQPKEKVMGGGWRRSRAARIAQWLILLVAALVGTTTAAPQLLAWP